MSSQPPIFISSYLSRTDFSKLELGEGISFVVQQLKKLTLMEKESDISLPLLNTKAETNTHSSSTVREELT